MPQTPTLSQWVLLFATALTVIIADQITKALIVANLSLYENVTPIPALESVFQLTYTRNTGAAFGLFPAGGNMFMVIAVIVSAGIIYYYRQVPQEAWPIRVGLGLAMGGALGNALDRMTRGYVVDFLHVFYEPVGFDFPVFNVADSMIVIAVLTMLVSLWWYEEETAGAEPTPAPAAEGLLLPEEEERV